MNRHDSEHLLPGAKVSGRLDRLTKSQRLSELANAGIW